MKRNHSRFRRAVIESLETRSLMATLVVTTEASSGDGSLASAITAANLTSGADVIRFDIPGAGVHRITGAIPAVTAPLTIDGTSQPGYSGMPLIELYGNGLNIATSNSKIVGLAIEAGNGYGISLTGPGKNVIQSNYIGTDATGHFAAGNIRGGIYVGPGSNNNIIGTDGNGVNDAAEGNLISGNGFYTRYYPLGGIVIDTAHRNIIAGNLIGTDVTGLSRIVNSSNGISIINGSQSNRIGTDGNGVSDSLEGNTITGYLHGVLIQDYGTNRNIVAGNRIGVNATGTAAIGGAVGVMISAGAEYNRIGSDANGRSDALERNLISGNSTAGIQVDGEFNTITGNDIGVDATGLHAIPNGDGIIDSGDSNIVGGTKAGARNVISGNWGAGLLLQGWNTQVRGNYVGLASDGSTPVPNSTGISVVSATSFHIGGRGAAYRNVISGNTLDGITMDGTAGSSTIEGNFIGLNAAGTEAVANGFAEAGSDGFGIQAYYASGVTLGGSVAAARNVISGNALGGISLSLSDSILVLGNYIGTNAAGNAAIGNGGPGILVTDASSGVRVGGTAAEKNVLSGNTIGIEIAGYATGIEVYRNYIGLASNGSTAMGNLQEGILIRGGASGSIIGSPTAGNRIAYNGAAGIGVLDASSVDNAFRGNSIFNNLGLGIDLGNDGVTSNQVGASGPNGWQPYPVLTLARTGSQRRIQGTIQVTPNEVLTLDFYANPLSTAANPTQGKRWLGSVTVTANAAGFAEFSFVPTLNPLLTEMVVATATNLAGNTSEFSLPIPVTR